jgi:hypothetical protein
MIARPRISRNEGNAAEIGAFEVGHFAPFRRPERRHLEDLVALLLAAGEALVDVAAQEGGVHLDDLALLHGDAEELERVQLRQPLRRPLRVRHEAQEVRVPDAGQLHGVLEGEEDARARRLLGLHVQQLDAVEPRGAGQHLVGRVAAEHLGQRRLAGAVGAHDGVDLAGVHRQVQALEDLLVDLDDLGLDALALQQRRRGP